MTTEREVVEHVRALSLSGRDPIGVMAATCVRFLKYRWAREFLKPDVTREMWDEVRLPLKREVVLTLMASFYESSWDAMNLADGTKAATVLFTYGAFCWLLGTEDDREFGATLFRNHEHFGKPALVRLTERYDLGVWQTYDNDEWVSDAEGVKLRGAEAMARWRIRNAQTDSQ